MECSPVRRARRGRARLSSFAHHPTPTVLVTIALTLSAGTIGCEPSPPDGEEEGWFPPIFVPAAESGTDPTGLPMANCPVDTESPATFNPASSALELRRDEVIIADEDGDALHFFSAADFGPGATATEQVTVPGGPKHVIALGDRLLVTLFDAGELVVIGETPEGRRALRRIEVGAGPIGLTVVDDERVAVALSGQAAVALVDLARGQVERRAVPALPWAVARVGAELMVTHLTGDQLTRLTIPATGASWGEPLSVQWSASAQTDLDPRLIRGFDAGGDTQRLALLRQVFAPSVTLARSITPLADGGWLAPISLARPGLTGTVPGDEFDSITGRLALVDDGSGGHVMIGETATGCSYYGGCPDVPWLPGAVDPGLAVGGGSSPDWIVRARDGFGAVPTAVAVSGVGRDAQGEPVVRLVNLAEGERRARVSCASLDKRLAPRQEREFFVGVGASALKVSSGAAWVYNPIQRLLTREPLFDDGRTTASTFLPLEQDDASRERFAGRALFHTARRGEISGSGRISCASCHPEGLADQQTWKFTFGPRNTPQLRGGILDTAPFHWPGDVATFADLNVMTIQRFMGGRGLPEEDLRAMGAFIDSLPTWPAAITAVSDEETAAIARGRAVFERDDTGCLSCHAGEDFTDNFAHDVGTAASPVDARWLQTPVLRSLAVTAPYLHDGSAPDLASLVNDWVLTDQMGTGSHLSAAEVDDLIAYLRSL